MNELECLHCGKPLIKTGRKTPKYCNQTCRYRYLNGLEVWERKPAACVVCSSTFLPRDSRQVCCSDACSCKWKNDRSPYEYTCQECGRVYQAKDKRWDKYCSRECAFEARRKAGDERKAAEAKTKPEAIEQQCEVCGKVFHAARKRACCSKECLMEKARQYMRKRDEARFKAMGKVRQCKICGAQFLPQYATKKRAFCSDKCEKEQLRQDKRGRGGNNTQRAKRLGLPRQYFNEKRILERDKWTCYLCGQPTPPELRGTYEPNAPELDHIVPLSKGGAHIKENVACICRRCNGEKGNRTLGEMGLTERVCVTQTRMQF